MIQVFRKAVTGWFSVVALYTHKLSPGWLGEGVVMCGP